MAEVTSPRQLGYRQQRGANGQFGRMGGEGDRNELYYYVYNGKAMEPRKVTNMRTGQSSYGGGAVASAISNSGRNASRRRNRGVQGIRLS